jgi:hypothetical protein
MSDITKFFNKHTPKESISKTYPYRFTCVSCKELYFCNQNYYDANEVWNDEKNDWVLDDTCKKCINKLKIDVCKDEEGYDNGFWRVLITTSHGTHLTRYTSWINPVINILRKEFGQEDIYCSFKQSCDNYFSIFPFVDDNIRYTKENELHRLKIHKNKVYVIEWGKDYKICGYKQIGKY